MNGTPFKTKSSKKMFTPKQWAEVEKLRKDFPEYQPSFKGDTEPEERFCFTPPENPNNIYITTRR